MTHPLIRTMDVSALTAIDVHVQVSVRGPAGRHLFGLGG